MNMEHEYSTEKSVRARANASARRPGARKGGLYLKEKPKPVPQRRRRRRKLNPSFFVLLAGLLAIVIGICLCFRSRPKSTIVGRWDLDQTTIYEFNEDGTGALVLMTREYEFNYVIEEKLVTKEDPVTKEKLETKENHLRIDFVDEHARDADYTFELQDNVLFLTGGPGDAKTHFALSRIG